MAAAASARSSEVDQDHDVISDHTSDTGSSSADSATSGRRSLDQKPDANIGSGGSQRPPRQCCLVATGVFCLVVSAALQPCYLAVKNYITIFEMRLVPETVADKEWLSPAADISMDMYIWDVLNPGEVLHGAKPMLRELGPYVYRMSVDKQNVARFDNNSASFTMPQYFYFAEDLTQASLSRNFTSINMPYAVMLDKLKYLPAEVQTLAADFLKEIKAELFQTLTVEQFLHGYSDPLIKLAHMFEPGLIGEKFGILSLLNGTNLGRFTVATGEDTWKHFNLMRLRNDQKLLPYWESDFANTMRGTDSTIFVPFMKKGTVPAYCYEMCRSVDYAYEKPVTHQGMSLWRYVITYGTFESAHNNSLNEGFCLGGNCLETGLLNASTCYYNAPMIMSWPHFYMADPAVVRSVVGLAPEKARHESFVDVEPALGIVPHSARRLQINVNYGPRAHFPDTRHLRPNTKYLPLVWFGVRGKLHPDMRALVLYGYQYSQLYVAVLIGALFLGLCAAILLYVLRRRRFRKRLRNSESGEKTPLVASAPINS